MDEDINDNFQDAELGSLKIIDDSNDEEDDIDDKKLIKEIKENISRNSLEIADLKQNNPKSGTLTDDSNPITPRSDIKHPKYVYANIFDESIEESNDWSDIKRYRFQKCLWKTKI